MNQQQRIVSSDYQIVDEDEYTVILVYATSGNINIYLPYASNFDKVIILKADNSLNEVFVHLKGNDTFQNSKAAYRLSRPYQLVEFTTDNESAWYAVSTYSSGSAAVGGSGGVSVHADLDGLLANDHPQYLHVSGSNAIASNFDMRGYSMFNILNINDVNILTLTSSIDGHILDTNNPHATTFSTLDPGTLAELNSIITDANLDDSGSARTPTPHSASHLSGGSDPISIQQLEARGITEGHLFAAGPNGNIVSFASSAFAPNDHGSLNGLGDLDHPQYETTASFRPYSASVNTFTASVLSFSSSYSTRISSLEAQSGSLTSSVDTLQKASASFRADIGDLQNASSSFSSRTTTLEAASGTFVTQLTELYAASASFNNTSASYAGFSASFVVYSASWSSGGGADITALNQHSSSIQSFSASIQSQTASIQVFSASMLAASGAFATISSSYKSFSASHAANHLSGGVDSINAQDLGANGLGANRLLMTNPDGGWTTVPSSSVGAGGGGGSSAPQIYGITGWSSTQYLSGAGVFNGGDNHTIAIIMNVGRLQAEGSIVPQTIISSGDRFSEGVSLFIENNRLWGERTNGGSKATLGGQRWYSEAGAVTYAESAWIDDKAMLIIWRHSGSAVTGSFDTQINGIIQASFATVGGFNPSTGNGFVGRQTNGTDNLDFYASICSIAETNTYLSGTQLFELFRYVKRNAELPSGLFQTRWSFRDLGLTQGDSIPTFISASEGTGVLYNVGGGLTYDITTPTWL